MWCICTMEILSSAGKWIQPTTVTNGVSQSATNVVCFLYYAVLRLYAETSNHICTYDKKVEVETSRNKGN